MTRGRVRVADIRPWTVERPIDVPVRMSFGSLQRRILAVVEVTDTDGHTGCGETWANYPPWIEAERSATVTAGLRPLLRDAEIDLADPKGSIGALQEALVRALWPLGRQWGAPGPIMQAVSGADQALWDLAGRRLGLSVATMASPGQGLSVASQRASAWQLAAATEPASRVGPVPGSVSETAPASAFASVTASASELASLSQVAPASGPPSASQLGSGSASMPSAGRSRRRIPVYASGIGPDDVASQVRRCRQAGFAAVKLRVGFGADVDRANLLLARQQLGCDGELLVDANQAWSFDEALVMAEALVAADVAWVEEPIADPTLDDFAAFTSCTGLAVAAGENVYGRRAWSALLASPDVAVIQPDVSKQGGISELLWLCEQAEMSGKVVEPHLYGGALAYAATLQVAACCPAVGRVELDIRPNPVRDDLLFDPPVATDGEVTVPDGVGLGVALRTGVGRRYR